MDFLLSLLITIIKIVGFTFMILLPFVPLCVYLERRFCAIIQDRVGPNRVGIPISLLGFKKDIPIFGLAQPMVDGVKLLLKEDFTPPFVRKNFYWLAPALTVLPALITICIIPLGSPIKIGDLSIPLVIADLDVGPLFLFAIGSITVYGIAIAGWSSNSKYPLMGGVRSAAQLISYEISLGISLIPIILYYGDLNLSNIVEQQSRNGWLIAPLWNENGSIFSSGYWATAGEQWIFWIPMAISFVIFTTSIFAETNRMPFDLPECETELVGGYHTEYSSMKFAMFFMGEYAAMVVASALVVTLYFGGWSLGYGIDQWINGLAIGTIQFGGLIHLLVFLVKLTTFVLFFILVRWTLPRFRFDQLMRLGWVVFFEIALLNAFLAALLIAMPKLAGVVIGLGLLSLAICAGALIWVFRSSQSKPLPNTGLLKTS